MEIRTYQNTEMTTRAISSVKTEEAPKTTSAKPDAPQDTITLSAEAKAKLAAEQQSSASKDTQARAMSGGGQLPPWPPIDQQSTPTKAG